MVYVLNKQGEPIMPCKEAKARKLLKQSKAKIAKYELFTIQLLFDCENQTQEVNLGIDAGSKHIGVSATKFSNRFVKQPREVKVNYIGEFLTLS